MPYFVNELRAWNEQGLTSLEVSNVHDDALEIVRA